jgi:hypothetical protein
MSNSTDSKTCCSQEETKEVMNTNVLTPVLCKKNSVVLYPRAIWNTPDKAYRIILETWFSRYKSPNLRIDECKQIVDETNYSQHFHFYNNTNVQIGHISYDTATRLWRLLSESPMNLTDLTDIAMKKVKHNSDLLIEDQSSFRNALVELGRRNNELEYCSKDWKLTIKRDQKNPEALVLDEITPYENQNPKLLVLTITGVVKEYLEDAFYCFHQLRNANKRVCVQPHKNVMDEIGSVEKKQQVHSICDENNNNSSSNPMRGCLSPLSSSSITREFQESTIQNHNTFLYELKGEDFSTSNKPKLNTDIDVILPELNDSDDELDSDKQSENTEKFSVETKSNVICEILLGKKDEQRVLNNGVFLCKLPLEFGINVIPPITNGTHSISGPRLIARHVFQNFYTNSLNMLTKESLQQILTMIEAGKMEFMVKADYWSKMTKFVNYALGRVYPSNVLFLPKSTDFGHLSPVEAQLCQKILLCEQKKQHLGWPLFQFIRTKAFKKCQEIENKVIDPLINASIQSPSSLKDKDKCDVIASSLKNVLEVIETNEFDVKCVKEVVNFIDNIILKPDFKTMFRAGRLYDWFEQKKADNDYILKRKAMKLNDVLEFIKENEDEEMADQIEASTRQRQKRKFGELSGLNSMLKIEKEKLEAEAKIAKFDLNRFQRIKEAILRVPDEELL